MFIKSRGLSDDLMRRELDSSFSARFRQRNVFTASLVEKLNLDAELKGHDGCVNCLEWSQSGRMIASGSDDLKLMFWDPFRRRLLNTIHTKHRGNIFSVKFFPGSNESLVGSAAADRDIYVYDVNKNACIHELHSHQGRVKRLETSVDSPSLIWSCGEDGYILQHDIRCDPSSTTTLLLNYAHSRLKSSKYLEAKCIAINPVRSELLAVGANDPFARVYDRRMLRPRAFVGRSARASTSSGVGAASDSAGGQRSLFEYALEDEYAQSVESSPVDYYVPGHLPKKIKEYRKRMKTLSCTFLSFSPNGQELLVNLGGEQLYLFDARIARHPGARPLGQFRYDSFRQLLSRAAKAADPTSSSSSNEGLAGEAAPSKAARFQLSASAPNEPTRNGGAKKKSKLPRRAEELKVLANEAFEQENYVEAIEFYNRAIEIVADSPILYGNRAAALLKRNWDGDTYAAMLDCYQALSIDENHMKSHFRLARCLSDLKWHREARECLLIFRRRFPDYARSNACESLYKEINVALEQARKQAEKLRSAKESKKKTRTGGSSRFYSFVDFHRFSGGEERGDEADEEEIDDEEAEEEAVASEDDDEDDDEEEESEENSPESNQDLLFDDDDQDEAANDEEDGGPVTSRKKRCDSNNNTSRAAKSARSDMATLLSELSEDARNKLLLKKFRERKADAVDFKLRYCGHCNVATDIKEANFIGEDHICAGSDDGSLFIWHKRNTNVVRVLKGDDSIVNCIQPHPYSAMLATSGIDPYVRIWTPNSSPNEETSERVISDIKSAALNNQLQMNSHPFEFLFLNLAQNSQVMGRDVDEDSGAQQSVACRPS